MAKKTSKKVTKKKLTTEIRKFLLIFRKKYLGLLFLLLFVNLFLLPPIGYYAELRSVWKKSSVLGLNIFVPAPTLIAKNITNVPAPLMTAKAVFVIDVPSAMVLYESNSKVSFPPASTTKIMTAMVSLEQYLLDQTLEVKEIYREGQNIKLVKGEQLTALNLIYALLVPSANDAAEVLASDYLTGRQGFIDRMNIKAQILGLENTHYINPSGIDDPQQYTSASDLARLSMEAIKIPIFSHIVSTPEITVQSIDGKYIHQLSNVNVLLKESPIIKGIKTGWTDAAGECLVGLAEKDGKKIITVVLGSQDRFGETTKLVDWVYNNYGWVSPI